jgi:hypothetical protein
MLQILKTKKTKKKFYDRWTRKISLLMLGAGVFRTKPLDQLDDLLSKKAIYQTLKKAQQNKNNILLLRDILMSVEQSLWQLRVERDQVDVYTNDIDLYDDVCSQLFHLVRVRHEPDSSQPVSEGSKILSKTLPHGRFRYKVYLRPHKIAKDIEAKNQYLKWIATQSPRIAISEAVKTWFVHTDWNWDRRYIWVEDEQTLLLLKLRNADVCGKVYEYDLCDK